MADEKKDDEEKKLTADEKKLADARAIVAEAEAKVEAARQEKLAELNKPKKFVPGKYICTEKCFHAGNMYDVGEVEVFTENYLPPLSKPEKGVEYVRHFRLIEE